MIVLAQDTSHCTHAGFSERCWESVSENAPFVKIVSAAMKLPDVS